MTTAAETNEAAFQNWPELDNSDEKKKIWSEIIQEATSFNKQIIVKFKNMANNPSRPEPELQTSSQDEPSVIAPPAAYRTTLLVGASTTPRALAKLNLRQTSPPPEIGDPASVQPRLFVQTFPTPGTPLQDEAMERYVVKKFLDRELGDLAPETAEEMERQVLKKYLGEEMESAPEAAWCTQNNSSQEARQPESLFQMQEAPLVVLEACPPREPQEVESMRSTSDQGDQQQNGAEPQPGSSRIDREMEQGRRECSKEKNKAPGGLKRRWDVKTPVSVATVLPQPKKGKGEKKPDFRTPRPRRYERQPPRQPSVVYERTVVGRPRSPSVVILEQAEWSPADLPGFLTPRRDNTDFFRRHSDRLPDNTRSGRRKSRRY